MGSGAQPCACLCASRATWSGAHLDLPGPGLHLDLRAAAAAQQGVGGSVTTHITRYRSLQACTHSLPAAQQQLASRECRAGLWQQAAIAPEHHVVITRVRCGCTRTACTGLTCNPCAAADAASSCLLLGSAWRCAAFAACGCEMHADAHGRCCNSPAACCRRRTFSAPAP